jgi:Demethylmenaquinone methyltransferase
MSIPGTASLFEASTHRGALPSGIGPIWPGAQIIGRALTVQSPPADNLWLHHAIYQAQPGDVLVVQCSGHTEAGYWGEIMTVAAQVRGIAGLVIDGGGRDRDAITALRFPVFARTLCIRGTGKSPTARGSIGAPVTIGAVTVETGDLIVGDADGVIALRPDEAETTLAKARQRDAKEQDIMARLRAGETTLAIYSLPEPGQQGPRE